MEIIHTMLPDGQLATVVFTVMAQSDCPHAKETEMGVALFTINDEGRNFDSDIDYFLMGPSKV